MKIVAIVGSPRPRGNTSYLVDQALDEAARHGIETQKIFLSQYAVGGCQGHDNCASQSECLQKDDAPWILERFRQADGVILATPVYYFNMTAQMKAFIDRNYFLYMHDIGIDARAGGLIIVASSEGVGQTDRALRRFLAFYLGNDRITTVSAFASKLGDMKNNAAAIEEARKLGVDMATVLKQTAQA
ncbi:MAG: flavodoxin family protein [Chloroflexota bacterium]|nr:flavodoxin family protein [Chloroflexota bacterium]